MNRCRRVLGSISGSVPAACRRRGTRNAPAAQRGRSRDCSDDLRSGQQDPASQPSDTRHDGGGIAVRVRRAGRPGRYRRCRLRPRGDDCAAGRDGAGCQHLQLRRAAGGDDRAGRLLDGSGRQLGRRSRSAARSGGSNSRCREDGEHGQVADEGSGALDVLERWSQAPRYGFLADFGPDQRVTETDARANSLCRYHLNAIQFYDWMWRHYRLLPPTDEFTDALGRRLSLMTIRAMIATVQQRGAAAFAYGAVYGAEPEYADKHPELVLVDDDGHRINLADLFFIMNIAPHSPWVSLIVGEFAEAVRTLGFDGIHLDQYGFPKTARTIDGAPVALAEHFAPLIDRAREAVVAERPDAAVIFNAVANWPIETVAATSQDAIYIEVWPPDEGYADLVRLVHNAKRLAPGKQIILAAYLTPFLGATEETVDRAEAAASLATAVIAAAGGFHLLLGERDGILCDPYYPKYVTLRSDFADRMRTYSDVFVRYEQLLSAPELEPWDFAEIPPASLGGIKLSLEPTPGAIWMIGTRKPGWRLIHLINLTNQDDTRWNAPRQPLMDQRNLALTITRLPPIVRAFAFSPDRSGGRPQPLGVTGSSNHVDVIVPTLSVWTVLALEVDDPSHPEATHDRPYRPVASH